MKRFTEDVNVIVDYINRERRWIIVKKNKNIKPAGKISISLLIEELQDAVKRLIVDSMKFDNGNKTAGVRVRVGLQSIVHEIKIVRAEILNLSRQKMKRNK